MKSIHQMLADLDDPAPHSESAVEELEVDSEPPQAAVAEESDADSEGETTTDVGSPPETQDAELSPTDWPDVTVTNGQEYEGYFAESFSGDAQQDDAVSSGNLWGRDDDIVADINTAIPINSGDGNSDGIESGDGATVESGRLSNYSDNWPSIPTFDRDDSDSALIEPDEPDLPDIDSPVATTPEATDDELLSDAPSFVSNAPSQSSHAEETDSSHSSAPNSTPYEPPASHSAHSEKQFDEQMKSNEDLALQLSRELGPSFDSMREHQVSTVHNYVNEQTVLAALLKTR